MTKTAASSVLCLGVLVLSTLHANAQTNPEIIIKQGDTIEWLSVPNVPHKVRFGGPQGASSFDAVKDLLDFDPATPIAHDPANPDATTFDSAQKSSGTLLKAKVKDSAEIGKTFVFICGVHLGQMLSYTFKIEAKGPGGARNYRILGEPSIHWHLHVDTTP
jgi:hypothetical protein